MKRQNIKLILVEPYFDLQTPKDCAHTGAKVLVMTPSVGGVKEVDDYIPLFDYDVNLIGQRSREQGSNGRFGFLRLLRSSRRRLPRASSLPGFTPISASTSWNAASSLSTCRWRRSRRSARLSPC